MKIILCILIMFAFASIGYSFKFRAKREILFYEFLKDYVNYFIANISLFKNNLVAIIENYLIMQKNKNAKSFEIFVKNDNIYKVLDKNISKYVSSDADAQLICTYLNSSGNGDYEFEKKKAEDFILFLDEKIKSAKQKLNTKADLNFKLMLALGAVICIILW